MFNLLRGQIYMIDLPVIEGSSIQRGLRPCILIGNEKSLQYSPAITIVPLTSKIHTKKPLITHVSIGIESGLKMESIALCEQILTVPRSRIKTYVGNVVSSIMACIDKAIKIQTATNERVDYNYLNTITSHLIDLVCLFKSYKDDKIIDMIRNQYNHLCQYCRKFNLNVNNILDDYDLDLEFNKLTYLSA